MPDRLKDRLASHRGPAVYPAKAAVPLHGSNRTRIEFVVEKVAAVAVQAGYGLSTSKGSGWRAGSTSARGSKDSHRHAIGASRVIASAPAGVAQTAATVVVYAHA